MTRITTLQNKIFNAHLEAFKNNSFDHTGGAQGGIHFESVTTLRQRLLDGDTVESLWTRVWENNVSITSQLMASPSLTGHISKTAIKDCRDGMKTILNSKFLNIK